MDVKSKRELDYYAYIEPLLTTPECGDTALFVKKKDWLFFCLIDVLGHGVEAYELAVKSISFLEKNVSFDIVKLTKELHQHILGSRGLAANMGTIEITTGKLQYVGIGNIKSRIIGNPHSGITNRSGIIGYQMPTPKLYECELKETDYLLMCSDGVTERFSELDYPEMLKADAKKVATEVVQRFGKHNDDASCMVIKYDNQV